MDAIGVAEIREHKIGVCVCYDDSASESTSKLPQVQILLCLLSLCSLECEL